MDFCIISGIYDSVKARMYDPVKVHIYVKSTVRPLIIEMRMGTYCNGSLFPGSRNHQAVTVRFNGGGPPRNAHRSR